MLKRIQCAHDVITLLNGNASRADFSQADAFAKKWFSSFVPEENRKAAKKQCFSGRRHVGYLWQAFSMGFAPAETVNEMPRMSGSGWLYLWEDAVLLKIDALEELDEKKLFSLPHFILCNEAFTETYVKTGRPEWNFYSKHEHSN